MKTKDSTTGPAPKRRGELSAKDAAEFLNHYKQAWETRNAELAAGLFTRDAQYWQGPFGEPITGREAIHLAQRVVPDLLRIERRRPGKARRRGRLVAHRYLGATG